MQKTACYVPNTNLVAPKAQILLRQNVVRDLESMPLHEECVAVVGLTQLDPQAQNRKPNAARVHCLGPVPAPFKVSVKRLNVGYQGQLENHKDGFKTRRGSISSGRFRLSDAAVSTFK